VEDDEATGLELELELVLELLVMLNKELDGIDTAALQKAVKELAGERKREAEKRDSPCSNDTGAASVRPCRPRGTNLRR
jgi:hypothetical protein